MIWRLLCRFGLCLGGVVCDHGKATCNKCGYCSRYGKVPNAEIKGPAVSRSRLNGELEDDA